MGDINVEYNFRFKYLIDENGNKTPCEYSVVNDDASFKIESTVKQNVRLKEAVLFSGKHGLSDDTAATATAIKNCLNIKAQ